MAKICGICAKNDILCAACAALLAEGTISAEDVAVTRALVQLDVSAEFTRCVATENALIIIAGRDAGRIIGRGGRTAQQLEQILGTTIDVIEEGDEKDMIGKLLRVPIIGINKVYGARERYKVRVERKYRHRVRRPSAAVESILGHRITVVFE